MGYFDGSPGCSSVDKLSSAAVVVFYFHVIDNARMVRFRETRAVGAWKTKNGGE